MALYQRLDDVEGDHALLNLIRDHLKAGESYRLEIVTFVEYYCDLRRHAIIINEFKHDGRLMAYLADSMGPSVYPLCGVQTLEKLCLNTILKICKQNADITLLMEIEFDRIERLEERECCPDSRSEYESICEYHVRSFPQVQSLLDGIRSSQKDANDIFLEWVNHLERKRQTLNQLRSYKPNIVATYDTCLKRAAF